MTTNPSTVRCDIRPSVKGFTITTDIDHNNSRFSIEQPNIKLQLWQEQTYMRTIQFRRNRAQSDINPLDQEIGSTLMRTLLPTPKLLGAFEQICSDSSRPTVIIDIVADDPIVASFPWETCAYANWDELGVKEPTCKIAVTRSPISLSNEWPAQEPIRILIVGATPKGVPIANIRKEEEAMLSGLKELGAKGGRFDYRISEQTHFPALRSSLCNYKPHIIHVISHGECGHIQLESSQGEPLSISGKDWANVLRETKGSLTLFITTACLVMQEAPDKNFWGLGRLLARQVPITIGMQLTISEELALLFSHSFYEALSASYSPLDAYIWARDVMIKEKPGSPEWIAPVFYKGTTASDYLFNNYDFLALVLNTIDELESALASLRGQAGGLTVWQSIINTLKDIDVGLIDGYDKNYFRLSNEQADILREIEMEVTSIRGKALEVIDILKVRQNNAQAEIPFKYDLWPKTSALLYDIKQLIRKLSKLSSSCKRNSQ